VRAQMQKLSDRPAAGGAPDQQVSLTNPDARSMATSGRVRGWSATTFRRRSTAKHHLIVAHEVTNEGTTARNSPRWRSMTRETLGAKDLTCWPTPGTSAARDPEV